jgi:hypothetical protein
LASSTLPSGVKEMIAWERLKASRIAEDSLPRNAENGIGRSFNKQIDYDQYCTREPAKFELILKYFEIGAE